MKTSAQSWAPLRSVVVAIAVVLAAVVAVAVGRRTGMLEPELAKRIGVLMFGVMLAVLGNYLPKFVGPWSTPTALAARRFAGWVFVVSGVAYVATCLFAPMPQAVVASSLIGIGAFVLAGANWLRVVGHTGQWHAAGTEAEVDGQLSLAVGVQQVAPRILLGLFFVFVIFLIDGLWEDVDTRWMAIGYGVASLMTAPFSRTGRVRRV